MNSASPILVACALKREASRLRRRLPGVQVRATGLGAARTGRRLGALAEELRPSLIVFTGTAGQLAPELAMGDVVLPREWAFEGGPRFACDPAGIERAGDSLRVVDLGLTVAKPVLRPSTRKRLHRETGAAVCDMESAAALRTAARLAIPAVAPKVVSDTRDLGVASFWTHFDANLDNLAQALREWMGSMD